MLGAPPVHPFGSGGLRGGGGESDSHARAKPLLTRPPSCRWKGGQAPLPEPPFSGGSWGRRGKRLTRSGQALAYQAPVFLAPPPRAGEGPFSRVSRGLRGGGRA